MLLCRIPSRVCYFVVSLLEYATLSYPVAALSLSLTHTLIRVHTLPRFLTYARARAHTQTHTHTHTHTGAHAPYGKLAAERARTRGSWTRMQAGACVYHKSSRLLKMIGLFCKRALSKETRFCIFVQCKQVRAYITKMQNLVSFYRALLQKRPIILRSLLLEATPYVYVVYQILTTFKVQHILNALCVQCIHGIDE